MKHTQIIGIAILAWWLSSAIWLALDKHFNGKEQKRKDPASIVALMAIIVFACTLIAW